jgi:hypothetical protein
MKSAEAVLSVKFNTMHSFEELMQVCNEDLYLFRNVPGLLQKYYVVEESTGAISGFYIFESKDARAAFWGSTLAKKIPTRYSVIPETHRVEQYEMGIVLNDAVLA